MYGDGIVVDVRTGPKGVALRRALYAGIAAIAAHGVNLVVDDVLHERHVLQAIVDVMAATDVLFVGLRLPLETAEQRERDRGDRGPGGARLFFDRVHAHGVYDLEVDTSVSSPEVCAIAIKERLQSGQQRHAFRTLTREFRESSV